jgi:hypothetical protein
MTCPTRPSGLRVKRSVWRAWWQLVFGPGPLLIRVLIWSQRSVPAEELVDDIVQRDKPERADLPDLVAQY